jgi:hypothetical protein
MTVKKRMVACIIGGAVCLVIASILGLVSTDIEVPGGGINPGQIVCSVLGIFLLVVAIFLFIKAIGLHFIRIPR